MKKQIATTFRLLRANAYDVYTMNLPMILMVQFCCLGEMHITPKNNRFVYEADKLTFAKVSRLAVSSILLIYELVTQIMSVTLPFTMMKGTHICMTICRYTLVLTALVKSISGAKTHVRFYNTMDQISELFSQINVAVRFNIVRRWVFFQVGAIVACGVCTFNMYYSFAPTSNVIALFNLCMCVVARLMALHLMLNDVIMQGIFVTQLNMCLRSLAEENAIHGNVTYKLRTPRTVDSVLRICARINHRLIRCGTIINWLYSTPLIMMVVTQHTEYLFCGLLLLEQLRIRDVIWFIAVGSELFWIVVPCIIVEKGAKETVELMTAIKTTYKEKDLQLTQELFALQVLHHQIHFTAADLFPLDFTIVLYIFSTVTTILVVSVPFQ